MNGAEMIALERERQITEEGWTPEHDAGHDYSDMAVIAATLAVHGTDAHVEDAVGWRGTYDTDADERYIQADPWGLISKHGSDPIRRLTIAGALIAAEIDRLSRTSIQEPADAL